MADKYLDKNGVQYLWNKIKNYIASHSGGGVDIDTVYPVGSIITNNSSSFNPNNVFDGTTWVKKANGNKLFMVSGSVVKTVNSSDSVQVHTFSEIQAEFTKAYGFTPTNHTVMGVSYTNGDGSASSAHVDGSTVLDMKYYAVFDRQHNGTMRINYAYFYNDPDYYTWQRTA